MKASLQVKYEVTGVNDGSTRIATGEWEECVSRSEAGVLRRAMAIGERHFWAKRGMEVPPTWTDRVLPRERDE
jgi:hypothetical protein